MSRVIQVGPDAGFSTPNTEDAATARSKPCAEIKLIHFSLHLKETKTKWPQGGRIGPNTRIAGLVLSPASERRAGPL